MREIQEYKNSRGEELVSDYIDNLSNCGRAPHAQRIFSKLECLQQSDLRLLLRDKIVKKLEPNLYELIISWREANYRIFFTIINQDYYLLHIFYKKSQKTPRKEINLARNRNKALIF